MNLNFHFDENTKVKVYDLDPEQSTTRIVKIQDENLNEVVLFMSLEQVDKLANQLKNFVELFAVK